MKFLEDAQGNKSHARLIAMIVAVSSTVFMWKMTIMGEMNTTYFMYYLLYGCGAQTINKAIDAWAGRNTSNAEVNDATSSKSPVAP